MESESEWCGADGKGVEGASMGESFPESAVYVQISIGSRNSAIHNVYHTSLRPSSVFEPRHPSLKVVSQLDKQKAITLIDAARKEP